MTPRDATTISQRARKLLRRGDITHRQYALLDCLLWSCRAPGRADARVSYTRLQSLAHMARETISRGLRRLETLGLLRRQKTRLRVVWGGGVASRQGVTIYTLMSAVCTEFDAATVNRVQESNTDKITAFGALAAIAERRRAALWGREKTY